MVTVVGFPGGTNGKEPTCQCRRCKRCRFNPWVRKIPWRRAWQPTSVFLPGKFHGQRSLAGCSPWGCKESDMTERLNTFSLSLLWASQVALVVKNRDASAGELRDPGSISGSARCPGGGHGNLLQYSCLENSMDRGAWRAIIHGVTKSWT